MSLERAIEYIDSDEYVEATPKSPLAAFVRPFVRPSVIADEWSS